MRIGLSKDQGGIEVTLFWSKLQPDRDPATIGADELAMLRQVYGDKVSGPEPITVSGQKWSKLPIIGGPMGINDPQLSGVVYVMAVRHDGQIWKVKLRATFKGKENLPTVEALLNNYRQN